MPYQPAFPKNTMTATKASKSTRPTSFISDSAWITAPAGGSASHRWDGSLRFLLGGCRSQNVFGGLTRREPADSSIQAGQRRQDDRLLHILLDRAAADQCLFLPVSEQRQSDHGDATPTDLDEVHFGAPERDLAGQELLDRGQRGLSHQPMCPIACAPARRAAHARQPLPPQFDLRLRARARDEEVDAHESDPLRPRALEGRHRLALRAPLHGGG